MTDDDAMMLLGFAWHARRRPGAGSPGPEAHPFDGIETTYRPLCWPIGPEQSGARNGGPGPAFLIITPVLAFLTSGPPVVGRGWEVEPAEPEGLRRDDGRVRLVGLGRHGTRWGTVAECEFEGARRSVARDIAPPPMAVLPGNPLSGSSRPEQARGGNTTEHDTCNHKKEHTMVLFPNSETTHPDDVRERVKREYRMNGGGAQPWDLVDQASRASFPASDVPPWTLGYVESPMTAVEVCGDAQVAGSRERPDGSPR